MVPAGWAVGAGWLGTVPLPLRCEGEQSLASLAHLKRAGKESREVICF